jgi:hypothetical protein
VKLAVEREKSRDPISATLASICTFAKLRKATTSFVMSVGLSARNNSAPTGEIFMKFDL